MAPWTDIPGASNVNGLTGFVRVGDSLYGTAADGRELCYRITIGDACPGQPFAGTTQPGVCTIAGNKTPAPPIVGCYDGTGNGMPSPLGLGEVFPAGGARSVVFPPLTIQLSDDLRTYFPFYTEDRAYLGQTVCYSWT